MLTGRVLTFAVCVAFVVAALERWRRRREYLEGPHYVERIQVLQLEKQLPLPAIRPLKAKREAAALRRVS